ncbi:hypothetical protein F5Y10DRAFT_76068 [Nemania abortiva]|nr:hypothetical protein F5Y10DRAFT_76068 [Nemania abortiva]
MPNPPRSPPSPGPGPGPMPLPYSTFGYDSPPSIPPSLSSSDSSDSSSVSSSLGGDHSILPPPISSRVSSNQRFARLGPDSQGHEIPLDAKWTRIRRSLVSAEVLAREGLRYEARPDFVAILGELKREDISELAKKSQKVRNERQRIASSTSSGPTQAESNGSKWQLKAHDGGFGPTHETSEDTNPAAEPIATAFQEDAPDLETAKRDQRLSSAKVQVPEADEQVPLATTTDKYSNNVTKKTDESGIPDDWLDSTTSATSNPSFNYIKRAREVLVRFLLEDVELSDLMMDAAIDLNISVDRLARDFRRLLDSYSRALKQVAQGRSQREMAKFFQHSSAYVSSASEMGLAASEEDEISRHINAIEDDQRQAVRELLIKFLEDINSLEESQIAPLPADTALILGEGCDTYYNREINNALAEVKDFLKSGSPFERLREELRTFVQPLKNEEQQPINSSPHKVDVESPTLPEQHARQSDIATSTYIDRTDSQGKLTVVLVVLQLRFEALVVCYNYIIHL